MTKKENDYYYKLNVSRQTEMVPQTNLIRFLYKEFGVNGGILTKVIPKHKKKKKKTRYRLNTNGINKILLSLFISFPENFLLWFYQ